MRYSNEPSLSFLISNSSRANNTRLVGSILYFGSNSRSYKNGFGTQGDSETSTGPVINDGHMTDWSFSMCRVSNLPDCEECSESIDEKDEVRLRA